MLDDIAHWVNDRCKLALAAWKLGGSIQHRRIYSVFCHSSSDGNHVSGNNKLPPEWIIVNDYDYELSFYKDLAHFLQHETDCVERTPGGAMIDDMVLRYDRYPIY